VFFLFWFILWGMYGYLMVDLDTTLHVCMAGLVVMVIDWSGGEVSYFVNGFLRI
jgi:hypothetical protein